MNSASNAGPGDENEQDRSSSVVCKMREVQDDRQGPSTSALKQLYSLTEFSQEDLQPVISCLKSSAGNLFQGVYNVAEYAIRNPVPFVVAGTVAWLAPAVAAEVAEEFANQCACFCYQSVKSIPIGCSNTQASCTSDCSRLGMPVDKCIPGGMGC